MPARTIWFLELDELRPSRASADVRRAEVPFGPLNRWLYAEIGREFTWTDRLAWSPARWQAWAEEVETWLAFDRATPAGYAELRAAGGGCEIEIFGLLEPFRGRGLGGALLTRAIERAAQLAPKVTVNTCSLDGPHALANYEARGFRVVDERVIP